MRYRLYLDESGDHTSHVKDTEDVGKRYLGLVGVAFQDEDYPAFVTAMEEFKREHLPYDFDEPPILHRDDILRKTGCFSVLRDSEEKKEYFDWDLLYRISEAKCLIFAVVLDKWSHGQARYRTMTHCYHYCLQAMLERYCGYLNFKGHKGDVLAESRGKREDLALKEAYLHVWENGTRYLACAKAQSTLTSKQIKLKPKLANIAGLQLADLLAHTLTRDVLVNYGRTAPIGTFGQTLIELTKHKYNRQEYRGSINGYGRVLLT